MVGRLIRARQEEHAVEKNEAPPVHFNIMSNGRYAKVKLAADLAVLRSSCKSSICIHYLLYFLHCAWLVLF